MPAECRVDAERRADANADEVLVAAVRVAECFGDLISDGCGPGHSMDTDRFTDTVVSSRDAEPLTAEHLPRGAHCVESVGLRPVFGLACRPVEFDDPLAVSFQ